MVMEPKQGVRRSSLLVILLEVSFLLRIRPMVRIFAGSSATSTTGGRRAHFAIRALRVLLLDVCVQGGVAQVGFRAVLALEVSALDIVFRAALSLTTCVVLLAILVALGIEVVVIVVSIEGRLA